MQALFDSVAVNGLTDAGALLIRITASGIRLYDFLVSRTMAELSALGDAAIDFNKFNELAADELLLVNRVFRCHLISLDWQEFAVIFILFLNRLLPILRAQMGGGGYIPILRDVDPGKWAGLCTVDGQRLAIGDVSIYPFNTIGFHANYLRICAQS